MLSGFAVEVKVFIVMQSFLHTHIHQSLAREIHPPKPLRITQPKFFTRVNEAQSIGSFLVLLFTTTITTKCPVGLCSTSPWKRESSAEYPEF